MIGTSAIKDFQEIFTEVIRKYYTQSLGNSRFSVCLELINTTSIFKESAGDSKKIKRPVSVLLVLSKLSESC